jgi:hypothetical protein
MEITLEEIQQKFDSLPEDLKWAIMAANVDDNIIEIGQTNGLNVNQMGQLSLETHMVMFGFTHPDKFEDSIKNSLELPEEKIHAIANAVNEKILKNIREKIMDLTTKNEEEKDSQVLKSAGIEIIPKGSSAPNTKPEEKKEMLPVLDSLELREGKMPDKPESVISQKLSGFVKNEVKETDHTLNNMTSEKKEETKPKVDPYREIPE